MSKFEDFKNTIIEDVNLPTYFIFHHNDLDGYAAACVLIKKLISLGIWESCIFTFPTTYTTNWEKQFSIINEQDKVFILDYSISNIENQNLLLNLYNNTTKDIYWIDHHASSDKVMKSFKEFYSIAEKGYLLTDNSYSAAVLTYCWCNGITVNQLVWDNIPEWIKLADDHDTWKEKYENSHWFSTGAHYIGFSNCFTKLLRLDDLGDIDEEEMKDIEKKNDFIYNSFIYSNNNEDTAIIIKNICNIGQIIDTNNERNNYNFIQYNNFRSKLLLPDEESIVVLCANKQGNSSLFGKYFYEYDAVISFIFNGRYWVYNMYSSSDKVDCSKYAQYFKDKYGITGGGHMHAAGWSAPEMHLIPIGKL